MRENAPPETARHVCHLNSDLSGSKRQEQNNPNAILRECCAPTKPCAAPCHTFHLWPQFWHTAKVRVLLPLRESAGMSNNVMPQVHTASNIHISEAKQPLFFCFSTTWTDTLRLPHFGQTNPLFSDKTTSSDIFSLPNYRIGSFLHIILPNW